MWLGVYSCTRKWRIRMMDWISAWIRSLKKIKGSRIWYQSDIPLWAVTIWSWETRRRSSWRGDPCYGKPHKPWINTWHSSMCDFRFYIPPMENAHTHMTYSVFHTHGDVSSVLHMFSHVSRAHSFPQLRGRAQTCDICNQRWLHREFNRPHAEL